MPNEQSRTLPIIANHLPAATELVQGNEYYFCTCGRSASQPFCDGSHAGSKFTPQPFVAQKTTTGYLCACKHTSNPPFCDGSHKKFTADDVGKVGPGVETKK